MNLRFVLHALSFFAASTLALSLGQAWAIAGRSRRTSHMLLWCGVFVLMLWLGMRVLDVHWNDPIMRPGPVRRSLVTITAALAAASLGAGLAWGTSRKIETTPFPRRVLALAQAHAAAVLIGGALAYVLLALIWMSQIH